MFVKALYDIITYTSAFSVLIPFFAGLIKVKKQNPLTRVLFFYISICVAVELISWVSSKSNWPLFHITQNLFTVTELSFYLLIYYFELKRKFPKYLIVFFGIAFFSIAINLLFISGDLFITNSLLPLIESTMLIALAIIFFAQEEPGNMVKNEDHFFVINLAVLLYFLTAVVLFLFAQTLAKSAPEVFHIFYGFQKLVNIIYNILLSFVLWKSNRKLIF